MEFLSGILLNFLEKLDEIARKDQLMSKIKEIFKDQISETQDSFEDFLTVYSQCIGFNILAVFIDIPNPEGKAKQLIDDLIETYQKFEEEFVKLIKLFEMHKNSIQKVLGDDWIYIEPLIFATKDEKINWKLLVNHRLYANFFKMKNSTFHHALSVESKRIPDDLEIVRIDHMSDLVQMVLDSEELGNLLMKANDISRNRRRRYRHR